MNFTSESSRSTSSGMKDFSDLLSIDLNAHLKNVATNTYQSPSHFPVELVRSALKRGAEQVEILIKRDRVDIRDNGSGIDPKQLKAVFNIYDSNQPIDVREHAISDFQNEQGIGLLALFAPSSEKIILENVSSSGKTCYRFEEGEILESSPSEIKLGTRITLLRKHGNIKLEKKFLWEYCGAVQKDIILNGNLISKKGLFPNALAPSKLKASDGFGKGFVGIPKKRNICCIWLLNQGIPWMHTTHTPWKGFTFEAAVEHSGKVSVQLLNWISHSVSRLYEGLVQQYSGFSIQGQARIEELIFKHNRLTNEMHLINQFSPFRVFNALTGFSLSQIKNKAASGTLYAVPKTDDPNRYNTHGKTVLLLPKHQADFLVNHHRIPIRFLSPVSLGKKRISTMSFSFIQKFKETVSRIHFGSRKSLNNTELPSDEIAFIQMITQYFSSNCLSHSCFPSDINIEPAMINSRGMLPAITVKKDKTLKLFIRRKHPLIRKAIHAVELNSENIELVAPLLIPEE